MAKDYEIAAAQLLVSIARIRHEVTDDWILDLSLQRSEAWPKCAGPSTNDPGHDANGEAFSPGPDH